VCVDTCIFDLFYREAVFGWQERVSSAVSTTRSLNRVAMVTDLLPMFRTICSVESFREATHNKRRYYQSFIHFQCCPSWSLCLL